MLLVRLSLHLCRLHVPSFVCLPDSIGRFKTQTWFCEHEHENLSSAFRPFLTTSSHTWHTSWNALDFVSSHMSQYAYLTH